jgi:HK97 family phage major capsid protein
MHRQIMSDIRALAALHRPEWAGISARIAASGVPRMDGTGVVDKTPRAALKDVQAELAELRQEAPNLEKDVDEKRTAYIEAKMPGDDSAEFKATEAAVRARGENLDNIEALSKKERLLLESVGGSRGARPGQDGPVRGGERPGSEAWSAEVLAWEENREQMKYHANSKSRMGGIDLGQVVSRDALAADITGTTEMRRGTPYGVVPQLRLKLNVLDLIPTGTMDGETVPYFVEEGSFDTAAETAEGSRKPEGEGKFKDEKATAQTVAHWVKLQKQSLADVPLLRSIVDGRLRYGVSRRLQKQVIGGKGEGSELKGIYKTTGLGVVKFAAGDLTGGADRLLMAITQILLADGDSTGILAHPSDWEELLKAKASGEGQDGHYFSNGPFATTGQTIWGVPLLASRAVPQHAPLAGDFEIGTQLFIREGVNVLMSDNDGNDFTENKVTMLGEMRAALAVWKPEVFVKAYLTKAAEEAAL